MRNKTPEDELTELMHHCCGCPFFSYEDDGDEGRFYCALLKEECYEECHGTGVESCGECDDADILAIVRYDMDGKVIQFDKVSENPKNCPRDNQTIPDYVIYPDVVHHHIDMGRWILRESLTTWGAYYIAFDKNGDWVIPIGNFPFEK